MQLTKEHVLIASTTNWANAVRPNGVLGKVSLTQPANLLYLGDAFEEITFVLSVRGVLGSPSSASLGVKFQFLQSDGALGPQFLSPIWYDLDAHMIANSVVGGEGWYGPGKTPPTGGAFGVVADQTIAAPFTVQRTVKNFGRSVRLVLDAPFNTTASTGWNVQLSWFGKPRK